jgi:hypothetical protein
MEKKIEVEIDGKIVRIMPHMLEDASRFGASVIKRQTRKVPEELLNIPKKEILKPDPNLAVPDPPLKTNEPVVDPLAGVKMVTTKEPEKPARKKPVKSKTK